MSRIDDRRTEIVHGKKLEIPAGDGDDGGDRPTVNDCVFLIHTEFGLSPKEIRRLTWYDFTMCLSGILHRRLREQNESERMKFMVGYVMAELWNSAGKTLRKGTHVKPMDFWKTSDDTQADDIDLQELMNRPELKYRFKKDG